MIDLNGKLFPLTQASELFPGRKPHVGTIFRWALRGIRGGGVKLETVLIGGRRFTSQSAVIDFVGRLNVTKADSHELDQRRNAAVRAAEHRLDADDVR